MMVVVFLPEALNQKASSASQLDKGSLFKWYFISLAALASLTGFLFVCLPKEEENNDESPPANWNDLLSVDVIFIQNFKLNLLVSASVIGTSVYARDAGIDFLAIDFLFGFLALILVFCCWPAGIYVTYRLTETVPAIVFLTAGLLDMGISFYFFAYVVYSTARTATFSSFFSVFFRSAGFFFIGVSVLPETLKNCKEKYDFMDESSITDRICSIVYPLFYFGANAVPIFIEILASILHNTITSLVIAILYLILMAFYEYRTEGVRNYFRQRGPLNLANIRHFQVFDFGRILTN
jgi:hypothetical protein